MSFQEATAVKQVDSHTYTADFSPSWVIGSVPHGGYVTACFQQVVRRHFATTLLGQNQPNTITLHLEFLRRTQTGPATFKVKDVKLGRQTSTVHVSLAQDGREEVVGYITNSNMTSESGFSGATKWSLHPKPLPISSPSHLDADMDPNWGERREWPFVDFRKATTKIRSWFPKQGQHSLACLDMWYCFKDEQSTFTNESLGYVLDTFPQIIESYVMGGLDTYGVDFEVKYSPEEQKEIMKERGHVSMWYPTLLLNLDIKKALPEEGVRWLFVRLQAKQIKNGRYDLEVLAMDTEGDLVALSHHVCFAVSAERNLAARRKVEGSESKL